MSRTSYAGHRHNSPIIVTDSLLQTATLLVATTGRPPDRVTTLAVTPSAWLVFESQLDLDRWQRNLGANVRGYQMPVGVVVQVDERPDVPLRIDHAPDCARWNNPPEACDCTVREVAR